MPESKRHVITVAISPGLNSELQKQLKRRKIAQSDAIRQALAAWLGKPELAEMASVGQPRKRPAGG